MEDPKTSRYMELEEIPRQIEFFLEKGELRTFERDEFFIREGQRSDLIGYIAEGGFRHLVEASDGSEKIAGYSFQGDFISVFAAFEAGVAAVSIQAFKESKVYFLKKDVVDDFQGWQFRCRLAEVARDDIFARLLIMHKCTPEERYMSLVGHAPSILNEVPLKELASFLRMTPETLSRIRKKMTSVKIS